MSSARHGRAPSHPGAVGIAAPGGGRPPPCGPVGVKVEVKVEVRSRGVDDPGWEPPCRGDGCRNGDSGFPGRHKISLLNGFDSPELMETRESPRGKDDASSVDAAEPIADGQPPTKPSLGADGWGRAVSSSIDVPKSRTGWNEPKMDHVMAAMVLTSLSSSCPSASPGSLTMPAFNTPDAPLPSEPAPKFFCASSWPEHDATSVSCGGSDDGRGGGASRVAECGWDAASTDRRSQPSTPSPKPLAPDAILPFRFESGSSEQRGDDDLTAGRQQQQQQPQQQQPQQQTQQQPQQQPQRQQQPPQQQRQRVKHEADMAGRCRNQPQPPPPPPSFLATSGATGKCAAHGAVVASFARPALKAKEPKAASKTFFNGSQARGISGTLPARLPPSSEHAPPPLPVRQPDSTWEARGAGGTAAAVGGGQPPPVFLCGAARGGGADGVSSGGGSGAGFRVANVRMSEDGDMEGGSFLDEPSPRKRKNSLKVMFQCMWPNCEKVLSTASGMQRHIRRLHLGRNSDSDLSDGEEDFYYSEMEVNMDSLTDGLSSLAPVSPTAVIAPPVFPAPSSPPPPSSLHPSGVCRSHSMAGKREPHPPTQLSRSAPTSFWHPVHTDHAYQGFPMRVRTLSSSEHRPPGTPGAAACRLHASLSPSPKSLAPGRKSRGEAKKCRKVYGMENKDMWCTACRWKKACQRFND